MKRFRQIFVLAAVFGGLAACRAAESNRPALAVDIKTRKPDDRVTLRLEKDAAALNVTSPSGIGGATITRTAGQWPKRVVVRLHLGGLESFAATAGRARHAGSVLSHSGNTKRLTLTEDGKEVEPPADAQIKVFDDTGKPVEGLPGKGGYFEVTLPAALLAGEAKTLELAWIDFYR